ncbi:MAG: alpha/beta hydrolase [Alcanivoracaceae bacterium]|nr:alpha/beta hydrolase [Alcanivoracaceae bacterium]
MSEVSGQKPVLAFAHANGIPGHSYDTFLAPLKDEYTLHVVDRVGHNPAYPVDSGWHSLSLELEAELAPLPKPLVGAGHSLGSVLMYLVAQRRPEWFSALIMLDPPMMNGIHGVLIAAAKLAKQVDRVTPAGKSKGRLDFWPDWTAVESYFGSRGLFRAFDSRCLQDYLKAGLEPFNEGWRLRFRPEVEVAIFRETPTSATRMPRLRVPGAIVTGRHSPAPFLHSAQRHVRRHGMLHRIADGSHMYPLEKPDATLALFRETLDSLLAQEATV